LESGDKGKARKELASAVLKDASFKLASTALEEVEKEARTRMAFLDKQIEETSKSAQERFNLQFAKYRVLADSPPSADPEQLAAHVIVAAHYGLRGQHDNEQRHLIAYAKDLAAVFKDQKSIGIYRNTRSILLREYAYLKALLVDYAGEEHGERYALFTGTSTNANNPILTKCTYSLLPTFGYYPSFPFGKINELMPTGVLTPDGRFYAASRAKDRDKEIFLRTVEENDSKEFPSIWAMPALQAKLIPTGANNPQNYNQDWSRGFQLIASLDSHGQDISGHKWYIAPGNHIDFDAFCVLTDMLESYSQEDLASFPLWSENWNVGARMAIDIANQASELTEPLAVVIVSVLRHVAATSDNVEIQKDANLTLITIAQKIRN
jgi:hypothetical protein